MSQRLGTWQIRPVPKDAPYPYRTLDIYDVASERTHRLSFHVDANLWMAQRKTSGNSRVFQQYGYFIAGDGIHVDSPYRIGSHQILTHLAETKLLEEAGVEVAPPRDRWSNLDLACQELPVFATRYVEDLRVLYANGGVEMLIFHPRDPLAFDACVENQPPRFDQAALVAVELMRNPVFANHPVLNSASALALIDARWEWMDPFLFSGTFASTLAHGGAYHQTKQTSNECVIIGTQLREVIWQDHYGGICSWCTHTPWSKWFYNIAWDKSWFTFDVSRRQIVCLFHTDTD